MPPLRYAPALVSQPRAHHPAATVACLAYYAEPLPTLERCVRSLAGVCTAVVALEGRWDLFDELPTDTAAQLAQLEVAAEAAGVELHHQAGRWPSQVAKRSELMRLGAEHGSWLLVIDADEYVLASDPPALARALEQAQEDVLRVKLRREPFEPSSIPRAVRRLYRASTGVHVRTAHNGYVTDDGRWLHGDPAYVQLEPEGDVSLLLGLAHDVEARDTDAVRVGARQGYLRSRNSLRLESWHDEWLARRRGAACATS